MRVSEFNKEIRVSDFLRRSVVVTRFWIYGCDEIWDVGILGFGDRCDLKRMMKIEDEKNERREIEERKIKKWVKRYGTSGVS